MEPPHDRQPGPTRRANGGPIPPGRTLANLEVNAIIQSGERDTQRIEHQLDHILGLCCDPDMLVVFKRLCRYYYGMDPVAAAGYVHAYREMWDMPDEMVLGGGV